MKYYLRVINPSIAILVLLICTWAAMTDGGDFEFYRIFEGGLSSYFFAKGLFSSSAVFLLGKILLEIIITRERSLNYETESHRKDFVNIFVLTGITVSLLVLPIYFDIGETHNLIESNPEKVKELANILTSYLVEVDAQMPAHKSSGEKVAYPRF